MGRSCKPHWLRNSAWHREKHKQFCQGAEEIAQTSPRICAQHRPATNTITWKWQYILAERPQRYATQSERETDGKDQIVDLNDSGINSLLDSLFHLCSGEDVKASAPWTLFHTCNPCKLPSSRPHIYTSQLSTNLLFASPMASRHLWFTVDSSLKKS